MKTLIPSDYAPPVCAAGVHVASLGASTCQCGERRYGEVAAPPTEDVVWNAAIEAAAAKCASEEANYDDVGEQCALRNAAEAIRALKREAK